MPNTMDVRQKAGLNASRQSTSPASPGIGTPQTPPRSPAMVERRTVRPAIPLCPRGRSSVPAAVRNFPLMINALLKKISRPHARPNHGAKACPLPPAPRAAAPRRWTVPTPNAGRRPIMTGVRAMRLPISATPPPAGSVSPAAGVRLPRPPAKSHGAKTALVMA